MIKLGDLIFLFRCRNVRHSQHYALRYTIRSLLMNISPRNNWWVTEERPSVTCSPASNPRSTGMFSLGHRVKGIHVYSFLYIYETDNESSKKKVKGRRCTMGREEESPTSNTFLLISLSFSLRVFLAAVIKRPSTSPTHMHEKRRRYRGGGGW